MSGVPAGNQRAAPGATRRPPTPARPGSATDGHAPCGCDPARPGRPLVPAPDQPGMHAPAAHPIPGPCLGNRLRWLAPGWSGLRRMLRAMTVDVTVKTVEPTPTAMVAAGTTWAEFPSVWGPMLDQMWSFLRGGAPAGLYKQGHNIMLYKADVPTSKSAFRSAAHSSPPVVLSRRRSRAASPPPQPTPARSPRSATLTRRCAGGARRTGTGWPPSLGDLRRSRPVERPFRRAGVLVAGGAVTRPSTYCRSARQTRDEKGSVRSCSARWRWARSGPPRFRQRWGNVAAMARS